MSTKNKIGLKVYAHRLIDTKTGEKTHWRVIDDYNGMLHISVPGTESRFEDEAMNLPGWLKKNHPHVVHECIGRTIEMPA